jgi:hypothetical protein
MAEFMTKYFGKIIIDEDEDGDGVAAVKYNNQEINIFFDEYSKYGDLMKVCLELIDQYVEIHEVAKGVFHGFNWNAMIKFYFEYHFDYLEEEQLVEIFGVNNFEKIDITNIVSKLEYPNLYFIMDEIDEDEDGITVSVDYIFSKEYSGEKLCIIMDEELNVMDIKIEDV